MRCRTWPSQGRGSTSGAVSLSPARWETRRSLSHCAITAPATRCAAFTGGAQRAWDAPRRDFVQRLRALGIPTRAFVVGEGTTPAGGPGDQVQPLEVGRIAEGLARS